MKIERSIDEKLPHFQGQNEAKRKSFTVSILIEISRRKNRIFFLFGSTHNSLLRHMIPSFATQMIVRNAVTAFRWPRAVVSCPGGRTMTGGGGRCSSADGVTGWTFEVENFPSSASEWTVQCDTPKNQNILAEVYAVCY